ncbi:VHS1005 protein [Vibrio phage 1]|nr:VHS1005 protein [Vibrio phage 1]
MKQTNFEGKAKPFEHIPAKDFSSLESLSRRRKSKGSPATSSGDGEYPTGKEYLRRKARKHADKLATKIDKPVFVVGDVVGSLIVRSITANNYLICECTCGQTVKKTQATIKTIDVCRHTTNGRYSQEFKSRNYRRPLYNAWLKMCTQNAEMNQSIYKPWQSFTRFVGDNLHLAGERRAFTRLDPVEVSPVDTPECFAWLTAGQARTVAAIGLPVAVVNGKPISLLKLAYIEGVNFGYVTKHLRNGISPNGVYDWLIGLKDRRPDKVIEKEK